MMLSVFPVQFRPTFPRGQHVLVPCAKQQEYEHPLECGGHREQDLEHGTEEIEGGQHAEDPGETKHREEGEHAVELPDGFAPFCGGVLGVVVGSLLVELSSEQDLVGDHGEDDDIGENYDSHG